MQLRTGLFRSRLRGVLGIEGPHLSLMTDLGRAEKRTSAGVWRTGRRNEKSRDGAMLNQGHLSQCAHGDGRRLHHDVRPPNHLSRRGQIAPKSASRRNWVRLLDRKQSERRFHATPIRLIPEVILRGRSGPGAHHDRQSSHGDCCPRQRRRPSRCSRPPPPRGTDTVRSSRHPGRPATSRFVREHRVHAVRRRRGEQGLRRRSGQVRRDREPASLAGSPTHEIGGHRNIGHAGGRRAPRGIRKGTRVPRDPASLPPEGDVRCHPSTPRGRHRAVTGDSTLNCARRTRGSNDDGPRTSAA